MKPSYLKQNDFGQEIPDDTPVVIHIKGRTISQFDQVRAFIRRELAEHADGQLETFEDANDFDVEDDPFPVSAAEYTEDTEAADREVIEAEASRAAASTSRSSRQSGQPEATNGGASSAPAVQAGAAPPAPSEPAAQ